MNRLKVFDIQFCVSVSYTAKKMTRVVLDLSRIYTYLPCIVSQRKGCTPLKGQKVSFCLHDVTYMPDQTL